MKLSFVVKLLAGILLVAMLAVAGYKLLDTITAIVVNAFSGNITGDDACYDELVTPEPLPTMPPYMSDDSFYDDAGSVDFGNE